MDALRNHAQHRSLPIHGMKFQSTKDRAYEPARIRFSVEPLVNVATLEDDPEFNKTALSELQAISNSQNYSNLLPFVREYAEALGRIHLMVRDMTRANFKLDDELIENFSTRAQKKLDTKLALAAVAFDAEGLVRNREYLTDRPTKRRQDLEKKNRHLDSRARRYVSSLSLGQ